MRDVLGETCGPGFELLRHFLAGSFESEMFSTRAQGRPVAVSAIALALPAGMLLMDPPYYHAQIGTAPETLRAVAIAGELASLTLLGWAIATRMVAQQWLVSPIAFEVVFRNWEFPRGVSRHLVVGPPSPAR